MKRFIAAFDGRVYSEGTVQYAIHLATQTDSKLVGVFIQDLTLPPGLYAPFATQVPYLDVPTLLKSESKDEEKVNKNIKLFVRACEKAGVKFEVHKDKGVPLQELLAESNFADLLIIDRKVSFYAFEKESPSGFLKDLLVESHCPVLIVPQKYTEINSVYLAYDNMPSSIYAIKMFSYVLPHCCEKQTQLVQVKAEKAASSHLSNNKNIKDFAKRKFKNIAFDVVKGSPEVMIEETLKATNGDVVVVMGSYARTAFSRFFHQSLANKILKDFDVPLFIAHV
jgi:nucleotide-binding universal stress UspA family protein